MAIDKFFTQGDEKSGLHLDNWGLTCRNLLWRGVWDGMGSNVLFGRCCGPDGFYDQDDRSCALELTSLTGGHGVVAGVLCSRGCWANSCCKTLFQFTMI